MAYGEILKKLAKDTSDFLQEGVNLFATAVDSANAPAALDVNTLLKKSILFLEKGATLWWSVFDRGDPLPPIAYFEETTANIVGANRPVSLQTALSVAATAGLKGVLQQLGGNKKLAIALPPDPGTDIVPGTFRQVLNVVIGAPSGGAPAAGDTYLGVVESGTTNIATVIVRVT